MKTTEFLVELERLGTPVFNFNEACRILGGSRDSCKTFLHRGVARGRIFRIERGKYHVKQAGPFEIASSLVYPSYVSFLSALEYHGLTTQLPVLMQVACLRQKSPVQAAGYTITFITMARKRFFGFERQGNAFMAEPEKAVIDGLYLPRHLSIDDACSAVGSGLSPDRLVDHAVRFASSVVAKRLGYILESTGVDVYPALKPLLNSKYDPLDPLRPLGSKRDRKWHLLVHEVIA